MTRALSFVALLAVASAMVTAAPVSARTDPTELWTGVPVALATNADGVTAMLAHDGSSDLLYVRDAAGTWSQPQDVGVDGTNADVAVSGSGEVTVAWVADGAFAVAGHVGAWSDPVVVETSDSWGVVGVGIDLEVNDAGAAVLTYLAGTMHSLKVAYRPSDAGAWQAPVDVGGTGETSRWGLAEIDSAGRATVAWGKLDGLGAAVMSVTSDATGTFAEPTVLDQQVGVEVGDIAVAGNAAGDTVVAWMLTDFSTSSVSVRERSPAGDFGPATVIDPAVAGPCGVLSLSVDPAGDAVLAYCRTSSSTRVAITGTGRRSGASWTAPRDIVRMTVPDPRPVPTPGITGYRLAPTPDERWRLVWATDSEGGDTISQATWAPEDTLRPVPEPIATTDAYSLGDPYGPVDFLLAEDAGSFEAYVAWTALRVVPYGQVLYGAELTQLTPAPAAGASRPSRWPASRARSGCPSSSGRE